MSRIALFLFLLIGADVYGAALVFGDRAGSYVAGNHSWQDQVPGAASIALPAGRHSPPLVEIFSLNTDQQSDQELVLRSRGGTQVYKRIGNTAMLLPAQTAAVRDATDQASIRRVLAPYSASLKGVGDFFLLAEHPLLPLTRSLRSALLQNGIAEGSAAGQALTLLGDQGGFELRLFARSSGRPLLAVATDEEFILLDPDLGWRDVALELIEGYTPRSRYTPSVATDELILADARRVRWDGQRFRYLLATSKAIQKRLGASEIKTLTVALQAKHRTALGVDVVLSVMPEHTADLSGGARIIAWQRRTLARATDCAGKQLDPAFCSDAWASVRDCGLVMVQPKALINAATNAARSKLTAALIDVRPFDSSAPRCRSVLQLDVQDSNSDKRDDVLALFQGISTNHALLARGIPSGQIFLDVETTDAINTRLRAANPPQTAADIVSFLRNQ